MRASECVQTRMPFHGTGADGRKEDCSGRGECQRLQETRL